MYEQRGWVMGRYYAKSASTVIASKSLHSQHDISLEHLVPKKKKTRLVMTANQQVVSSYLMAVILIHVFLHG